MVVLDNGLERLTRMNGIFMIVQGVVEFRHGIDNLPEIKERGNVRISTKILCFISNESYKSNFQSYTIFCTSCKILYILNNYI